MRPVCIKCKTEYDIEKNGVIVHYSENVIRRGDMWICPDCGNTIVVGLGDKSIVTRAIIEAEIDCFGEDKYRYYIKLFDEVHGDESVGVI